MAVRRVARGRLIAVDGGGAVTVAANTLARELRSADGQGGISSWDASGIFTELAAADAGIRGPSARTLTLLYAADLAFRLRWQIRPALEEGHWVIVAPYVETARALGIAAGLPRRWLQELFRFAPKPDVSHYVADRSRHAGRAAIHGYPDAFVSAVVSSGDLTDPVQLQKRFADYLAALVRRGRSSRLGADAAAVRRTRARG